MENKYLSKKKKLGLYDKRYLVLNNRIVPFEISHKCQSQKVRKASRRFLQPEEIYFLNKWCDWLLASNPRH